jgi:hypothetical protein
MVRKTKAKKMSKLFMQNSRNFRTIRKIGKRTRKSKKVLKTSLNPKMEEKGNKNKVSRRNVQTKVTFNALIIQNLDIM